MMKTKKIISSALVFVMLFTTLVAVFPIASSAEGTSVELNVKGEDPTKVDGEVVQQIIQNYRLYGSTFKDGNETIKPFTNAREALEYEMGKGYIDYVKYAGSAVYVNRYTGLMYFENTVTGQILTSNPYDPAYMTQEGGASVTIADDKLSQLELSYFEATNTSKSENYNTLHWIFQNAMAPKVTGEGKTLSVTYTLGSNLDLFIAPGAMLYETALEKIFHPMFDKLESLLNEHCGEFDGSVASNAVTQNNLQSYDVRDYAKFFSRDNGETYYRLSTVRNAVNDMIAYAGAYDAANGTSVKTVIDAYGSQIVKFTNYYEFTCLEKVDETASVLSDTIKAFGEGKIIMVYNGVPAKDIDLADIRHIDKALKYTLPELTMDMVNDYEKECGYEATGVDVPRFEVTVCYTIDDNGDLLVSVPMNALKYNSELYSMTNIAPLKHFGAGDMDDDGYVFFPDGSGAIVEFDDFYFGSNSDKTSIAITLGEGIPMYGADYCYAKITGKHREQLVMPVYGLVNEDNSTKNGYSADLSKVTNGFFAVIEEGSALASLTYLSGGGTHKYISVYSTFTPFPTDTYDLSQSISVSGLGSYTTATAARFTGSITTRYTLLVDHAVYEKAASAGANFSGFLADYVGMATCYRSYLERTGQIELLGEADVLDDIPLYIEALGSIDVTKKILSFPVTVSEALTSFEDVELMYKELSDAIVTLNNKANACDAVADEIEQGEYPELRQGEIDQNRALAEKYRDLATKVENIKNVNFKLTGFANGGMHSTYPTKLKWESSVGGKRGFNTLLTNAKNLSASEDSNFGVYPDFDFMYINNTAAFDGIARRSNSSFMVDNRYASKQEYDSVNQTFEALFALVISSDSLNDLYTKFEKKYSKFDVDTLSVSTLSSDLNSNFNKKNPVVREESLNSVSSLLERMSASYKLMGEKGNIYTVKYLDHILRAPIDSSHYNVISYTIPFYGMVLHGYVNYTGSPLNYSGSPEYDILRSIENGASLYYILCMQNTNYLKEDPLLSDYYGVDYNNWFEKIVAQYKVLNDAVGNLQNYRIVDHTKVLAERVIDNDEMAANYRTLIDEFAEIVDEQISANIDAAIKNMRNDGKVGEGLKFAVSDDDFNAIVAVFAGKVNLSVETLCEEYELDKIIKGVIEKYSSQYGNGSVSATLKADDVKNYKSKYAYITDSAMFDENYVATEFTCDNGNVVMVTYEKEVDGVKDTVIFILNYNVFTVKIKLDGIAKEKLGNFCDADGYITLDKYEFIKG